jgi:hypothetical protein
MQRPGIAKSRVGNVKDRNGHALARVYLEESRTGYYDVKMAEGRANREVSELSLPRWR